MTAIRPVILQCDGLVDDTDGCPLAGEIETDYETANVARDWASREFGWQSEADVDICDRCAKRDTAGQA